MPEQKALPVGGKGVLARLYWMFFGNILLLFLLVPIFEKRPNFPSLLDAVYLVTVVSLITVRFIDIRFLNGQTGEGSPATMAHWRRYTMILALVGVGAWLLVRAIVHVLK